MPLKTKVARWKRLSLEPMKRPLWHIRRNGWRNTQGTQLERRVLPLESHSYNKLNPSPKAYCFLEIDDRKPFLIVRILA
jgi:hypothetical protein